MAQILIFPQAAPRRAEQPRPDAPCEIIIFPGVRVEYHAEQPTIDLSRRFPAEIGTGPARSNLG